MRCTYVTVEVPAMAVIVSVETFTTCSVGKAVSVTDTVERGYFEEQ